jgi:hypothetical protein
MTKAELSKYIADRMSLTQTQFDNTKSTFLTAGILVALSVSPEKLKNVMIFNNQGVKIVMTLTILSAVSQVLSFVFAEHQVKRHDKLVGADVLVTRLELLILGQNEKRHLKYIPWFYGKFHNYLISIFNNISTGLLLLALSFFLILLNKS